MKLDVCQFVRAARVAAFLLVILPAKAQAQSEVLDAVLQTRARQLTGSSRVIVEFRDAPDTRVFTSRRGIPGRQLDGALVGELENIELTRLASDPRVRRVTIDRPAFGTLERTGAAVGATLAREEFGYTGKGIGVAVIDSGITAWHDDLYLTNGKSPQSSERISHFKDFTREISPRLWMSERPSDEYGHGTHVAGIIAGNGFDSNGARTGIAPRASLIGLKVLDAEGHGYVSDVIAAIDYAIAVKNTFNIRIINVSVASGVFESYETDPLTVAARRAVEAGIVVVAASGNHGLKENGEVQYGGITSPGNAPWVITVGAASHQGTPGRGDDIIAAFSSRGPTRFDRAAKPDVVAPGVGIESLADRHSTLYSTFGDYLLSGTVQTAYKPYLSLSGSSMAAPVVTGTVALMLEANPTLTPNAVKAILEYTAEERPGEPYFAQGAGLLNTKGAIRLARFFGSPGEKFPEPGDTIANDWIAWSQDIVWGNERVSGGVPLPGANAWALNVRWGVETTRSGRPIVWGAEGDDSIIWGVNFDDSIIWGVNDNDTIIWGVNFDDSIIWGVNFDDSIIWGVNDNDSIIWGVNFDDSIIWGVSYEDTIIWGVNADDTIIWGVNDNDTIIWGVAAPTQVIWAAEQPVDNRRNRAGRH